MDHQSQLTAGARPGRRVPVSLLAALLVMGLHSPAAQGAGRGSPTLGSRALAAAVNADGIGKAHPREFNVGGFPAFQNLHWFGWGAPTAAARGYDVPDGPFPRERVSVRATDLGWCDGKAAYRRIRVRYRVGGHWRRWETLGTYGTAAAGPKSFCVDEGR